MKAHASEKFLKTNSLMIASRPGTIDQLGRALRATERSLGVSLQESERSGRGGCRGENDVVCRAMQVREATSTALKLISGGIQSAML